MENSNDTIGNRTCDLLACSAVPQPTAPPRAPSTVVIQEINTGPSPHRPLGNSRTFRKMCSVLASEYLTIYHANSSVHRKKRANLNQP
jgi:hypothetical protein